LAQATPDQYPDYHFLFIASNVGVEWFFDAARLYWDRFRPTVINNFDFLSFIPTDRTVIVTAIMQRDYAPQAGVDLSRNRIDAYFDPVVRDTIEEVQAVLDQRAALAQPFGVPIREATLTPPPLDITIPTPALPLQPRGDETPTLSPTPLPTGGSTPAPIQPTPGSIFGG
jgi:hypothetical protein